MLVIGNIGGHIGGGELSGGGTNWTVMVEVMSLTIDRQVIPMFVVDDVTPTVMIMRVMSMVSVDGGNGIFESVGTFDVAVHAKYGDTNQEAAE